MDLKKRYGLILPVRADLKRKIASARMSAFNESSDSDDEQRPKLPKRTPTKETKKDRPSQSIVKALAQDPLIYEYDAVYDKMEMDKEQKAKKEKCAEHKRAEKRKREAELRKERQVQKEREAEGNQFTDKEAFVTLSYRKKMEELAVEAELEEQQRKIEGEKFSSKELPSFGVVATLDVTRQKDLSGFYRHLYRQTMGEEKHPVLAEDTPVKAQADESSLIERAGRVYRKKTCVSENDSDSDGDKNKEVSASSSMEDSDLSCKEEEDSKEIDEQTPSSSDLNSQVSKSNQAQENPNNIFARRNAGDSLEAFRQRYLQRKATRLLQSP